jgi:hypothetical protein
MQVVFLENGEVDFAATSQEAVDWFWSRYMRLPHYPDGAPVKMGDAVKDADTGKKVISDCMKFYYDGVCQMWTLVDHRDTHRNTTCNKHGLTTFERYVEPDSLERIQKDAFKTVTDYWGCGAYMCGNCPVKIDNLTPGERYNISTRGNYSKCTQAQRLDIIERTRKLYEKSAE